MEKSVQALEKDAVARVRRDESASDRRQTRSELRRAERKSAADKLRTYKFDKSDRPSSPKPKAASVQSASTAEATVQQAAAEVSQATVQTVVETVQAVTEATVQAIKAAVQDTVAPAKGGDGDRTPLYLSDEEDAPNTVQPAPGRTYHAGDSVSPAMAPSHNSVQPGGTLTDAAVKIHQRMEYLDFIKSIRPPNRQLIANVEKEIEEMKRQLNERADRRG
jgi:hypothetical protein